VDISFVSINVSVQKKNHHS